MLRPFSAVLALSLILGTPGLPAYQAAAQAVARPVPTATAASAWGGAVGGLLHRSAAAPVAGMTPRLESVLGQTRFALEGGVVPLHFAAHLPAAYAQSPDALAALPAERQAGLLDAAVAAASAELQPRAAALLARLHENDGHPTPADREELRALDSSWYYLEPGTARTIRALAKADRGAKAMGLADAIARALGRKPVDAGKLASDAAAASELDFVLAGAARLAKENPGRLARPGPSGANAGFTRDVLSPYLTRALDRAASLQSERGMDAKAVSERILSSNALVFGGKAAKPALRALRPAGEWTEFVAAASLHAAFTLADVKDPAVLRKAAADGNLLLPIPAWHGAAESAATVAALLESRHGKAEPEFPAKGRLFTLFGVPVRANMGFYLFAGLMAFQFANNFFAKASNPLLLGLTAVALLYVTLLGHEYGHVLAARAFGVKTHGVELNFLGGAAHIEREPRRPLAEFLIAAAGPAVNFAVVAALIPLIGALDPGALRAVLSVTMGANLMLGALNLIPAYPMDGGRLLRSGLAALLRDHYKATHAAAWVGLALGALGSFWAWQRLTLAGDWSALGVLVIGFFVMMGSRAAMLHPGTTLLEPDGKLRK